MNPATIRPAYDMWPQYDRRLREVVAGMTDEQLVFSHEAYHCAELSQTLGINGLPQIDLWRPD